MYTSMEQFYIHSICNSYNMDARALACLLHEGAKRPRAINELSARASMLQLACCNFNDL